MFHGWGRQQPPGKRKGKRKERKQANNCCNSLVRVGEYRRPVDVDSFARTNLQRYHFCRPVLPTTHTIQICIANPGMVAQQNTTFPPLIYPRSTNKDAEEKKELMEVVRSTVLAVPSKEECDHRAVQEKYHRREPEEVILWFDPHRQKHAISRTSDPQRRAGGHRPLRRRV